MVTLFYVDLTTTIWLGRVLECLNLLRGPNDDNFKVEWPIPMEAKKEGKSVGAEECWTRRWHKEPCLPWIVNVSIVLFFHKLPSHAKNKPLATHVILEASVIVTSANLQAAGAVMNLKIKGSI